MSNNHFKDRRLSYKAKGLLSVILSLPPEWDYTIGGLAALSADGTDSVNSGIRELEKYGYITRRQLRDERGRMSHNEYLVYENPADNPLYANQGYTAEVSKKKPQNAKAAEKSSCYSYNIEGGEYALAAEENAACESGSYADNETESFSQLNVENFSTSNVENCVETLEKSDKTDNFFEPLQAGLPEREMPQAEKAAPSTLYKLNKKKSNNNQSNHSNAAARRSDVNDRYFSRENCSVCSAREREEYSELIKANIDFEERFKGKSTAEELVSIMTDVVCSRAKTIRVNGEFMSAEIVRSRFLKLKGEEIEYVLKSLKTSAAHIGNMRSYLITALYNSKDTIGHYYTNLVYRC